VETPKPAPLPPWGPWAALGLGFAIVFFNVLTMGLVAMLLVGDGGEVEAVWAREAPRILAFGGSAGALVMIGATFYVAARRPPGVREGLGLVAPRLKHILLGLLGLVLFLGLLTLVEWLVKPAPAEEDLFGEAGQLAGPLLPLLLAHIVLFGPFAEELLFRGFLFGALARSSLGPIHAAGITTILWAALHFGSTPFEIMEITVGGALLGVTRWRTGSVWLCFGLHALNNAVAMALRLLL
jgi:uncharacterized protein